MSDIILNSGNVCPSGFSPITSMAECRVAMDLSGYDGDSFRGEERDGDWPRGCYRCQGVSGCINGSWFNNHPIGSANGNAQTYCARDSFVVEQNKILFIGDSDVDYWDSSPEFAESYNVAIGGYTCEDTYQELDYMLDFFDPERIVIVCGENDIASHRNVTRAFSWFQQIVNKASSAGTRVVYMGTKPEPATTGLHAMYRDYDERVRAYANDLAVQAFRSPLQMVNVYDAFEDLGNPASLYARDRLHLSNTAYALWTRWAQLALSDEQCVEWYNDACGTRAPVTIERLKLAESLRQAEKLRAMC